MTNTTQELRRLLAEATPGEWHNDKKPTIVENMDGICIAACLSIRPNESPHNAALICAAVNALPALLDVVEAATGIQDDLIDRAEIDPDGTKVVNASCSRWIALCDALAELEQKK